MKVILNGKHSEESSVLALGMFDGVHIGHQVLLERARTLHMRCGAPKPIAQYRRVCVLLRSATYNRMYRDMHRIAAIMQP